MDASLRAFFPLLSDADLTEFNDVYPLSAFDNSSQLARVGTGESELRCAVGNLLNSPETAALNGLFFLGGNHG